MERTDEYHGGADATHAGLDEELDEVYCPVPGHILDNRNIKAKRCNKEKNTSATFLEHW